MMLPPCLLIKAIPSSIFPLTQFSNSMFGGDGTKISFIFVLILAEKRIISKPIIITAIIIKIATCPLFFFIILSLIQFFHLYKHYPALTTRQLSGLLLYKSL